MLKWRRAGMVGLYGMPLMALGGGDFHLPGSQPNPGAYHFQSTELCSYCHGDSQYAYNPDTGEGPDPNFTSEHEPHFQWMGGMMAQAARDPVFRAALTIAEQDAQASGSSAGAATHPAHGWKDAPPLTTAPTSNTTTFRVFSAITATAW